MKYRVHITTKAEADIDEVLYYIETELLNPQASDRLYEKIAKELRSLNYMPEKHQISTDPVLKSHGIRYIVIESYLAFFIIDQENKTVHIIRFIYGKRDWVRILRNDPLSLE